MDLKTWIKMINAYRGYCAHCGKFARVWLVEAPNGAVEYWCADCVE